MAVVNKTALMTLVQTLSGLLPTSVIWAKDPRPMVSDVDRQLISLSYKTDSGIGTGVDDIQRVYVADPESYTTTYVGQRNLVLTIKCEAYDLSVEAIETLEKIRTSLHWLSSMTALNTINLALQSFEAIQDLPTTYDQRLVSVAVMDVHLGGVSSSVDTTGQETWIETVNSATDGKIPGTFS